MTESRLSRKSVELGATPLRGPSDRGNLRLRRPRLADGPSWRHTLLLEEDRIRPAFGQPGVTWSNQVSLRAWADRVAQARADANDGRGLTYVVDHQGSIVGEVSFGLDPRNQNAEISAWVSDSLPPPARRWAIGALLQRTLALPEVSRVVAPVAVTNEPAQRLVKSFGFVRRATADRLRTFDGRWSDHDIWWLDQSPENMKRVADQVRAALAANAADTSDGLRRNRRLVDGTAMAVPTARSFVGRCRSGATRARETVAAAAGGKTMTVRLGGAGLVELDDVHVGVADIRHDLGGNTLEVWVAVRSGDDVCADAVADGLVQLAAARGARRISWVARQNSTEARAAERAGLRWEGFATAPEDAPDGVYGLWGTVRSPEGT